MNINNFRLVIVFAAFFVVMILSGCGGSSITKNDRKAAQINVQLGLSYLKQNNIELAKTKLRRALDDDPESSNVHWANALLHEKLGDIDQAESHYQKAIDINPRDSDAQNNFGAFLCRNGRAEAGLEAFNLAVKNSLYVYSERAYTNAGICLIRAGDQVEAETYFRKSLNANPRYAPGLYQMALLLHEQKRYLGARAYRQRLVDALPAPSPKALLLCVKTEREMANYRVARECETQLKSKFPGSSEAAEI